MVDLPKAIRALRDRLVEVNRTIAAMENVAEEVLHDRMRRKGSPQSSHDKSHKADIGSNERSAGS